MSREQMSNDRYTFAFGVDHTPMGCFLQLWEKKAEGEDEEADGMDMPQVEADEMYGYRLTNSNTLERNDELNRVLMALSKAFAMSEHVSWLRDEENIIAIGVACGFDRNKLEKSVRELWD